ncbi:MAG: hypothetical protein ACK504_00735 [Bacteroidota bacterium]|jgi:hypothetical protein
MKKIFLILAVAGITGSIVAINNHDGKDKAAKKECTKECKKGEKSCCKDKSAEGSKACASTDKKSCCKSTKTKAGEVK